MFKVDRKAAAGAFIETPGTYLVAVDSVEEKITPKGDEVAVVKFKDDATGNTIRDDFYNTAKSHWRVNSLIAATGVEIPDGTEIDFEKRGTFVKFFGETFVGKTLTIVVGKEDYTAKDGTAKSIAKVKSLKPATAKVDDTIAY